MENIQRELDHNPKQLEPNFDSGIVKFLQTYVQTFHALRREVNQKYMQTNSWHAHAIYIRLFQFDSFPDTTNNVYVNLCLIYT
jgi:hypothetical protein